MPDPATEPPFISGYGTADQVRRYALDEQRLHDPRQQNDPDAWPDRCGHCHYTRHPCHIYELATIVLALIDREAPDEYFT